MNDFSFLQLEPRILKHNSAYDDPWNRIKNTRHTKSRKAIHVIVTDTTNGCIMIYKSINSAANMMGYSPTYFLKAINRGKLLDNRYMAKKHELS